MSLVILMGEEKEELLTGLKCNGTLYPNFSTLSLMERTSNAGYQVNQGDLGLYSAELLRDKTYANFEEFSRIQLRLIIFVVFVFSHIKNVRHICISPFH